jgi:hypothetical protein
VNLRETVLGMTASTIDRIVPVRVIVSQALSASPRLDGNAQSGVCDDGLVCAPSSVKEYLLVENGSVIDHIDGAGVVWC